MQKEMSVLKESSTHYTRVDFMALRYLFNKLPIETVYNVYNEDDLYDRGIETHDQLRKWLLELKKVLIAAALKENPLLAEILTQAEKSDSWHRSLTDHLFSLGERDYSRPNPSDSLSLWFRGYVASALQSEGLDSLESIRRLMEVRGKGWFRPISRIGAGRARAIERWFESNEHHLGEISWPKEIIPYQSVELTPLSANPWVPLEQVSSIYQPLDGSSGKNRSPFFSLIAADNDLEAIQAYLYKFRGQAATLRAYTKELERFLLWAVSFQRVALSNVLQDDCEAFKDFIASVPPNWIGARTSRKSARWRPFSGQLSPKSQRYAVQVVKSCFEWLVNVRYLNGNPWITVADPITDALEAEMQIDKALPGKLWDQLAEQGGWLDQACDNAHTKLLTIKPDFIIRPPLAPRSSEAPFAQLRLARAAICLMGYSGLRREEVAGALRSNLKPVAGTPLWELAVLGKRRKWRTVFIPERVIEVLEPHWDDRGLELRHSDPRTDQTLHLISPLIVPTTPTAQSKHEQEALSHATGAGFSPDGLYRLIKTTLQSIATSADLRLSSEDSQLLFHTAPHALRHTFATSAAAKNMPLDVLQRLLGHASIDTTSIYIQSERTRSISEVQKLFDSLK